MRRRKRRKSCCPYAENPSRSYSAPILEAKGRDRKTEGDRKTERDRKIERQEDGERQKDGEDV